MQLFQKEGGIVVAYGAGVDLECGQVPSHHFSVRWTGQLQALEEGHYTISVNAKDSAKVWIGDLNGTPRNLAEFVTGGFHQWQSLEGRYACGKGVTLG